MGRAHRILLGGLLLAIPLSGAAHDVEHGTARAPALEGEEVAAEVEPEAPPSRLDRFVAGLFSLEPRPAKKRPGGKFRYLEKE